MALETSMFWIKTPHYGPLAHPSFAKLYIDLTS